jgi:drug/metabolite transporter (DMT)-like permease
MNVPRTRLVGYLYALGAGTLWGTTGVLSTALYAQGAEITGIGFLTAAAAYAGTTVLARSVVPRVGSVRFLFLEIAGGTVLLGALLPFMGRTPLPPSTGAAWGYVLVLAGATVLAANFLFFGGVKRIEAAPTAVAATIEPVVAALLALVLFTQHLTPGGWLGLAMVVGGVALGYARDAARAG